jgi:hypothetical protein
MLYISLTASALLLFLANWSARRARHAGKIIVCLTGAFLLAPVFAMCLLPTVAVQALLLCGATVVWRATHRGSGFFLAIACGATLVAYGLSGIVVLESEREYTRLRDRYPYESMEGRLPVPRLVSGGTALLPATAGRLSRLEEEISNHANSYREWQLRMLHEDTVELFINSPGFGVTRMIRPSETGLSVSLRRVPVPVQPGSRFTALWSPGDVQPLAAGAEATLLQLLDDSILDFVNPRGFGYFKDRRHVAGFETHRFSQVPGASSRLKVQSLELVSLLLHDEPEIYVLSELPRMDRLHGVPTRPLDRFENFGLAALRQGEEIFASEGEDGVRVLGAIRNIGQCEACHGGRRGDLLGAFSYALRAEPSSPSAPNFQALLLRRERE